MKMSLNLECGGLPPLLSRELAPGKARQQAGVTKAEASFRTPKGRINNTAKHSNSRPFSYTLLEAIL
jgi:hypothetical protein